MCLYLWLLLERHRLITKNFRKWRRLPAGIRRFISAVRAAHRRSTAKWLIDVKTLYLRGAPPLINVNAVLAARHQGQL